MTKEDHALWATHDLAADSCELTQAERSKFEDVTHLFADNAGAGDRNGFMASRLAETKRRTILRVASRDSTAAASRQPCDMFGQLRRVLHILEGCPVMIICNLRTPAGLVNGATGKVVGVVLRRQAADPDLRGAVSAADVEHVVVDIPKYHGPVIYLEHPTWVPIAPTTVRHKRAKGWERLQLPLVLAWGITIHKSQGLTFPGGAVVDFAHHPSYQPVAQVGLAFVGMSRTCMWNAHAFRSLPGFWDFRKVLKDKLFKWRGALEERMDGLHDQTMSLILGRAFTLEEDVRLHREWSERKLGRVLSEEELKDIRDMLSVRGLRPAPVYADEPQEDRSGPRGGGGRKHAMGMKPPPAKKLRLEESRPSSCKRPTTVVEGPPDPKRARPETEDQAGGDDADEHAEPEQPGGAGVWQDGQGARADKDDGAEVVDCDDIDDAGFAGLVDHPESGASDRMGKSLHEELGDDAPEPAAADEARGRPLAHQAAVLALREAAAQIVDAAASLGYVDNGRCMEDNTTAALRNPHNMCYLNALLHVLSRVALLRQWFQQHLEKWRQAHAPLNCPLCLIAQDVNKLCIDVDATPFVPPVVRTRALWSHGAFDDDDQHDVTEAVRLLFDSLNSIDDRAALALDPDAFTRRLAVRYTTPMWKAIGMQSVNRMECRSCGCISDRMEEQSTLSLDLPDDPCTIEALLANQWGDQPLKAGDDPFKCPREPPCSHAAVVKKSVQPRRWPKVLVLSLKRWRTSLVDGRYMVDKVHTAVDFETLLTGAQGQPP